MAISPAARYPGKIATPNTDYPYGSARNISAPGDGLGTPLEQHWLNDLLGFIQSALADTGAVPNNASDSVSNPQILTALKHAKELNLIVGARAVSGAYPGECRYLTGGASVGDGVEGWFTWDSISTLPDNGATCIKPDAVTTGRWRRIINAGYRVSWFGSNRSAIIAAVSEIGSTETTLTLTADVDSTGGAVVIPKNIDTAFLNGSKFTGTGSVTINKMSVVPDHRIFGSTLSSVVVKSKWITPQNFGAAGDGVTDDTASFIKAFECLVALEAGTLLVPPKTYFFGNHSLSDYIVNINGLKNTTILAYGATFTVNTTAERTPFLFNFVNFENINWFGGKFFDLGFNPESWLTHDRWGMAGITLDATEESNGFTLQGAEGENITYFILAYARAHKNLINDVTVRDCKLKNAYYGVEMAYIGKRLKVDNFICKDVRRGFLGYGTKDADIDIKLLTTDGFLGSNGFLCLVCEGETFDDTAFGGAGVVGELTNCERVRINLNIDGYETHSNFVHLYHQQANSVGHISDVDINVKAKLLPMTTPLFDTNIINLDHEVPSGAILGVTSRQCKNINISGTSSSVSGYVLAVDSVNTNSLHTVSVSESLARSIDWFTSSNLTQYIDWLKSGEMLLPPIIPIGTTSAGAAAGLSSKGTYRVENKRVFFNAYVTWSSHTGTGNLRLSGLPLAPNIVSPSVEFPMVQVKGKLPQCEGYLLFAVIGGSAYKQILLYENASETYYPVDIKAGAGELYISGSYLTA